MCECQDCPEHGWNLLAGHRLLDGHRRVRRDDPDLLRLERGVDADAEAGGGARGELAQPGRGKVGALGLVLLTDALGRRDEPLRGLLDLDLRTKRRKGSLKTLEQSFIWLGISKAS